MTSRKRSGSGSKRPKEKVVYLYEKFLYFGGNRDLFENNPEFWEEFFLLQPNVEILEAELLKLSSENLCKSNRTVGRNLDFHPRTIFFSFISLF